VRLVKVKAVSELKLQRLAGALAALQAKLKDGSGAVIGAGALRGGYKHQASLRGSRFYSGYK
jgi:stage V sporulation protein SpoVS